jgi:hypothetical protein
MWTLMGNGLPVVTGKTSKLLKSRGIARGRGSSEPPRGQIADRTAKICKTLRPRTFSMRNHLPRCLIVHSR